jgi:MYXO-CTERM domain-containing protein
MPASGNTGVVLRITSKTSLGICSVILTALAWAPPAVAATWYVSPTGTAETDCTTRANPCALAAAATAAVAGDTVVLMDGVYKEPLAPVNSGTASSWITYTADECATPIIEGAGAAPTADVQDNGVGSATAEYVRFVGLVSRGWNIGFGNGWAGGTDSNEVSNGHWEIDSCISYSNGRTGFTFFSAPGFHLKNSISAHNGSSSKHAWSSGVTLFEATGTNLIEGSISFENTDSERHTDGSGFIVDEASNNATFVNNLAFGNSGSCLRLTKSSGTRFINNTCYRNSQFGSQATGPSNPGELYFTNSGVTVQGVTFMNNVIVGTGTAPSTQPVVNMPTSGWTNNVVTTGTPSYFTAPTGTNPSFVPASGATQLIGKGGTGNGVPTTDIGFDPKCLVKRTPVMVGEVARLSSWQFDVDIDYIKSIGGVAKCFNAGTRSGTPDIGAYRAGNVTTTTPGSCVAPPITGAGGAGGGSGAAGNGTGGAAGAGGSVGGAGGSSSGVAGSGPTGGVGGVTAGTGGGAGAASSGAAGSTGGSGAPGGSTGGGGTASGGTSPAGKGGDIGAAGSGVSGAAGSGASTGAAGSGPGSDGESGGCGCDVGQSSSDAPALAGLALLALGAVVRRRRLARSRA